MEKNFIDFPIKSQKTKNEKKSIKDFKIDTSHYKSNGPKIVKIIDIKI